MRSEKGGKTGAIASLCATFVTAAIAAIASPFPAYSKSRINLNSCTLLYAEALPPQGINSQIVEQKSLSIGFNRVLLKASDLNIWRVKTTKINSTENQYSARSSFATNENNQADNRIANRNLKAKHCQISLKPSAKTWENPQLVGTLEDRKGTVETLAFTPDGKILVSGGGSQNPRIQLWDLQKWEKIRTLRGHKTRVLTLAIAPDSETLASGSDDSTLNIWNLKTGELKHTIQKLDANITSLAISPDSRILASGDLEGLKLWDLTKRRPLKTLARFESIYSVAISPNGLLLASGSRDGGVKLWNLHSGELIGFFQGHKKPVNVLAFTPDSQILVTGSYDTTIKLWNVATGTLRDTLLGHPSPVNAIAIHPEGQILASAGRDGIRFWDLRTGMLFSNFSGHSDWVRSLAFSPDGHFLASGGFDNTIKIWQAGTPP